MSRGTFLFHGFQFVQLRLQLIAEMRSYVEAEDADYLLNVNETEYVDHLKSKFGIQPMSLDLEHIEASSASQMIPAEMFPPASFVERGGRYSKQVITFHIPFSGNSDLLLCVPTQHNLATFQVRIDTHAREVQYDVIDFHNNPGIITSSKDRLISYARTALASLSRDLEGFDTELREEIRRAVAAAKAKRLQQANLLSALNVPIRKSADTPPTFAVPVGVPKKVAVRPAASQGRYQPEPTLDESTYQEILQIIQDTGKTMERLPSTYSGKDEETLRDHLLLVMQPRFEGSATGETFNKAGKTDILLRHENHNLFVAECKFWRGAKRHHDTVDQLLGYLTWRDSKTAVVYFVDTKEIAAPLASIEESTPQHGCFVAFRGKQDASWFRYEMHLPGDHGRPVHMAILCFHLPKID